MKNVLFATTTLVATAFAGSAYADGHMKVGFAGGVKAGYNDEIEGGLFGDFNLDVTGTWEGDGYTFEVKWGGDADFDETGADGATWDDNATFTLTTPAGELKVGDLDDKGASERFYDDLEGMAYDVFNDDGNDSISWHGDAGDFGYAISTPVDGDDENWSVGFGGSFGMVTAGLGYDNSDERFGVSAGFDAGVATVNVAFTDNSADEQSIGVEAIFDVGSGVTATAYYAMNDPAEDAYGILVDYENGPLTIGVDFHAFETADSEVEIDVVYDAGVASIQLGYDQGEDGGYVGAVIPLNDYVDVIAAYAEFDEAGDYEFKDGTSLYVTASF